MKVNIAKAWEKRSKIFGDEKQAVMEQSFPSVVNDYIEKIHLHEIEKILGRGVKICLDVGCGYGRLAYALTKKHPGIFVHGIDIAPTFAALFNKKLKNRGKAVVGDMLNLPFRDNFFDCIWVVVSFMYIENKNDQKKGMHEFFRVLKPGGKLVLIEPNKLGVDLIRLWGFIPYLYRTLLGKSKVETFGITFSFRTLDVLIASSQGKLLYKRGYPALTMLLLPSIIIGRTFPAFVQIILALVKSLDKEIHFPSLSYFLTYVVAKGKK